MNDGTPAPKNFDKSKALTMKSGVLENPSSAATALLHGIPLPRKLTRQERIAVAVASCLPTYVLTITSASGRDEVMKAFRAFKSRRRRDGRGTWVYVGICVASATGEAGYHLHLLLWGSVHINSLNDDLAALGLGHAHIRKIEPIAGVDPIANALGVTAYVLGQEEPVFGTLKHQENLPRPKSKRSLFMPQDRTLKDRHPELLLAVNRAKDPTVPDDALLQPLH